LNKERRSTRCNPIFSPATTRSPSSPKPNPALEQLALIDPDSLTPRQALDALYALKGLLK
jgi:DNA mismatch repair protein MutS